MKKRIQLWTILFAFLFGQLIQLVTNAMAHYLYVSDPVVMCVTVGIVTVTLVIITAMFTLMDEPRESNATHRSASTGAHSRVFPIFMEKRPPLDTDPEDIDAIDKALAKEGK